MNRFQKGFYTQHSQGVQVNIFTLDIGDNETWQTGFSYSKNTTLTNKKIRPLDKCTQVPQYFEDTLIYIYEKP